MGVIEQKVATVNELQDGQMIEVKVGEKKILLSRVEGKYYATSHMCTHYKAQLVKGTLSKDGRLMCPWHGACFSVKTGDIEDAPALDALAKFDVKIEGNDVIVIANEEVLNEGKRTPSHAVCSAEDQRLFVIIGGGAAGMLAAETLREEGYSGRILMISRENHLPIDRIKLSKALKVEVDKILLRNQSYFTKAGIETKLGVIVTGIDKSNKIVQTSDGENIQYDSLLICTGGDPRFFWPEAKNLKNIFLLRGVSDASSIDKAVEAKEKPNIVVIGSSFIGMEAAAILVKVAGSLIVVGMEKVPFERVLGVKIGESMQKFHESKDVKFRMGVVVEKFESSDGENCNAIILKGGERIECDIVVVGAGVAPATGFLKDTLPLEKDGSIVVDSQLKVIGTDNIYAAGDIARYPFHLHTGGSEMVRIEHWNVAQQQGRVAAKNMLGQGVDFKIVPYFWTTVFGKSLRYTGHALNFDDIIIQGSLENQDFLAYYTHGDEVVAVASMGRDPAVSLASEAFRLGLMLTATEVKNGKTINDINIGSDPNSQPASSPSISSSSSDFSSSGNLSSSSSLESSPLNKKKSGDNPSSIFQYWPFIVGVLAFAIGFYVSRK